VAELPTRALSLYAPWCYAILHAGKDVENRVWDPGHPNAKFRGAFWIHASMFGGERGRARENLEAECLSVLETAPDDGARLLNPDDLVAWSLKARGKIVGVAEIVGAVEESESPWFFGPLGLQLAFAKPSAAWVPCRGALGFWRVPPDVLEQLGKAT
jgi:hypothetical protein